MKNKRILSRFLLNIISYLFPPTRFFIQKKIFYQLAGMCIGNDVKINSEVKVYGAGSISIGHSTWIGIGTEFYVPNSSSVCIGKNCDVAPRVTFLCGSHKVGAFSRRAGDGFVGNIQVGNGVWIGARSILLPNVSLGDGVVVAAGSVVKQGNYPANSLIGGNPAKIKKCFL